MTPATQPTADFKGDHISVRMFGAKGDGVTDDTVAIQAAVDYVLALTSVSTGRGIRLIFPFANPYYLVSATINLGSYLEIQGFRAKIHFTGTGSLFSKPLSVDGSIHGLILEGVGIKNTWAITIDGTAGNGALNEHIHNIRFRGFGALGLSDVTSGGTYTGSGDHYYSVRITAEGTPDVFEWSKDFGTWTTGVAITGAAQALTDGVTVTFGATHGHDLNSEWVITARGGVIQPAPTSVATGGDIENRADSGQMSVENCFFSSNGTGFSSIAPTDGLTLEKNYFAGFYRGIDFSGEIGAAGIKVIGGINVCNAGAMRVRGPGSYIVFGHEFESTGPVTNGNSAAYEVMGSVDGPPTIKFYCNPTAIHNDALFGVYVDGGPTGPVYSEFISNNIAGAFPVNPAQYGFHNGNSSGTSRFEFNHMLQPAANLYDAPNDQGVMIWPLASTDLTDAAELVRSVATLDDATSGGTFTGSGDHTYHVQITHGGTPDVFEWNMDGSTQHTGNVITGAAQALVDGVTVTFAAMTGHQPGTTWEILETAGVIGPATLIGTFILQSGDFHFSPTGVGNTLLRVGAGSGAAQSWGWLVQNAAGSDASRMFETSSAFSGLSWIGPGMSGLYFPSSWRLGCGAGGVAASDGPGSFSIFGLPAAANNAAAVTAGLAAGRLYLLGDTLGVVHAGASVPLAASAGGTGLSAPGTSGSVLTSNGTGWISSALPGGTVASVFGRTGAIVAASGDYTAAQVGAAASGVIAAGSVSLAKLTTGGTNGSITWNADGQITGFVAPT